jgi:hypothetical protein
MEQDHATDTVRLLTLLVAFLALILSVLSLAWQVIMWRYTSSFVTGNPSVDISPTPRGF